MRFMGCPILHDRLLNIANLAKKFAETFNVGDWAYLTWLWHDIGEVYYTSSIPLIPFTFSWSFLSAVMNLHFNLCASSI